MQRNTIIAMAVHKFAYFVTDYSFINSANWCYGEL